MEILSNFCRFFPVMLAYENYDRALFDRAMQLAGALGEADSPYSAEKVIRRVAAWQLVPVALNTEDGGAASGTLTIRNVSGRIQAYTVGADMERDVRTLNLTAGTRQLPVYGGHLYELEFTTPVPGGPARFFFRPEKRSQSIRLPGSHARRCRPGRRAPSCR